LARRTCNTGVMLNQIEHGTRTERPGLLIAHGLYGSARNWGVIAKRLSDTRKVVAVDMRNHGLSPWYETQSYPDMAADLRLRRYESGDADRERRAGRERAGARRERGRADRERRREPGWRAVDFAGHATPPLTLSHQSASPITRHLLSLSPSEPTRRPTARLRPSPRRESQPVEAPRRGVCAGSGRTAGPRCRSRSGPG